MHYQSLQIEHPPQRHSKGVFTCERVECLLAQMLNMPCKLHATLVARNSNCNSYVDSMPNGQAFLESHN